MCRSNEESTTSKRETWSRGTNSRLPFDVNVKLNVYNHKCSPPFLVHEPKKWPVFVSPMLNNRSPKCGRRNSEWASITSVSS